MRVKIIFFRTLFSQSGASLTMSSLAAYLKCLGFDVDLCYLEKDNFHSFEDVIKSKKDEKLIIIAKPNFKDIEVLFPLLQTAKKRELISKVIFCGPFSALNSKSILIENSWVDGIIIDQIESVAGDYLRKIKKGESIKNCKGGLWRYGSKIIRYVPGSTYISLDKLPLPLRDVEEKEKGQYVNIEFSRGCIYRCSFCHIPLMQQEKKLCGSLDFRNPVRVVDEMEFLNKKLGKTLFIFNDSVFWSCRNDNERILTLCSEIKKRKLKINIYIYLRCVPFIDDDILEALVRAGLVRVFLGIENNSQMVQKTFNKTISNDAVASIQNKLKKMDVDVHIGYIVFEPYSTINDIWSNIEYLHKTDNLFRLGTILEPVRVIPGTRLYNKLINDGMLNKNANYREITYGYDFAYDDVKDLYYNIKKIFIGDFGKMTYEFEYYCSTMKLLIYLMKKEKYNQDAMNDSLKDEFYSMQREITEILYQFFKDIIPIDSKEKLQLSNLSNKFKQDFSNNFYCLKIAYFNYINHVSRFDNAKVLDRLYTGIERL